MRAVTASHEERRQTPAPGADVGVQLFGDHGEHLCRRHGNVAKVLLFRSFQMIQATRRTSESKARLKVPGTSSRVSSHQSASVESLPGARCWCPAEASRRAQTSRVNGQEASRWSVVSPS